MNLQKKKTILFSFVLQIITLFATAETGPFVILNNPMNPGFGAVFSSILSALHKYDIGSYKGLKVDLDSGMYLDEERGPNWWEYFFEPIVLGNPQDFNLVLSQHDVSLLVNEGFQMSRERGYELIQKYIRLKPRLEKSVNHFVKSKFKGDVIIGVHHRGTDKKLEAPIVPYEKTLWHLNWWMTNQPKEAQVQIFVATDDQDFLDYMIQLYPGKVVYKNFIRSRNGDPIHYSQQLYANNYQKGKEAVIDCVLLSKCNIVLFPAASAFSMASLKFNPYLSAVALHGGQD